MTRPIDPSYEEALRFFQTFTNLDNARSCEAFEKTAENMAEFRRVLLSLGDPQFQYSVIHVAGSKAKGSTSSYLASILRRAGKRTGLVISPHLLERTERVSVNGVDISREEYGRLTAKLRGLLPDGRDPEKGVVSRYLEAMHLKRAEEVKRPFRHAHGYDNGIAFLHFANEKVDFAVVEVGMGGRLDHSNMFDQPPAKPGDSLISLITAMAYEHKIPLGKTLTQITAHKAGVIRPHGLTVLGPQKPEYYDEVWQVVENRRKEVGAPPILDTNHAIKIVPGSERFGPEGCDAEYQCDREWLGRWMCEIGVPKDGPAGDLVDALTRGLRLHCPLAGRHQANNLRTVLGCAVALAARGTKLSVEDISEGIASTVWPARFEILSRDPLIIVDCCHEALSIEAFSRTFREFYGDRPVIAVTGFLRDNDVPAMCRAMIPHLSIKHMICTKVDLPHRAMKPGNAVRIAAPILGVPMTAIESPGDALLQGYRMRQGDEALLVFADFYLTGAARRDVALWLKDGAPARA